MIRRIILVVLMVLFMPQLTLGDSKLSLNECLMQSQKILFIGKINNNLPIHMELQITKDKSSFVDIFEYYSCFLSNGKEIARYKGYYFYDKIKKNIKIEAYLYSNGYISIFEFDKDNNLTGCFGGFVSNKTNIIKGIWGDKNGNPKYSFYLTNNTVDLQEKDYKIDMTRVGHYEGIQNNDYYRTYLTIFVEVDGKFKFNISGNWKENIGFVDGVATFDDASFSNAHFINEKDKLKMSFNFNGKTIDVKANDVILQYGGLNVSLVGTFQKK